MTLDPQNYQEEIQKQKISLFLYGTHTGAIANAIVALATVWLLWEKVPHPQALAWLIGMFFFSFYRVATSPKNKSIAHLPFEEVQLALYRYLPGITGTGFFWALASWVMFVPNSWRGQSILIMMLLGIITASLPIMAPLLKICKYYILACTVPTIFHLAISPSAEAKTFAVLGGIMILLILLAAKKLHDTMENSLLLSFQKEQLVEELQEAVVKAEEANQVKSDFLANISHEVRTPMNAIIGFSDYLNETPLNEQQSESLDIIRASSKSLLSLINNILDFAKIESGKITLEEKAFPLLTEAQRVAKIFSHIAAEKDLSFVLNLDPKLPAQVVGDVTRLKQILNNLLNNAIKFTEQGQVTLSVQLLTQHDGTLFIQFSVEDSGVGIPADKIKNIFNSFEQADSSITRKYGGTGLGLSITNQLVTVMGGHIQVRSLDGEGTVFFFNLPFKNIASHQAKQALSSSKDFPSLQGKNVLLVEDNIFNQKIATILVEKMQPDCLRVANNGQEALDFLQKEEFFCVLMDLQMPVMGGLEATEKIRSQTAGVLNPKIPIIALTAHAREEDRQECMDIGMDDYLSKPYKSEDLYAIFKRLLGPQNLPYPEEA